MEEKHIYTSSRWVKFIDTFKSYKKSLKEILPQFPKPKTKIVSEPVQPITSATLLTTRQPKPKLKIQKPLPSEKIKLKISKKISKETEVTILSYTLFSAIVVVIGLGIFLSYKSYLPGKSGSGKSPQTQITPTPVLDVGEIANWKIYRNEKYGFEFEYPSDWLTDSRILYALVFLNSDPGEYDQTSFWVGIQPVSGFALTHIDCLIQVSTENIELQNIIAEKKIFKENTENGDCLANPARTESSETVDITFKNREVEFVIEYKYPVSRRSDSQSVLDQILSTFKFTDSEGLEGKFCGGIAGVACPEGYTCKLDGNYPDAGGKCVKN